MKFFQDALDAAKTHAPPAVSEALTKAAALQKQLAEAGASAAHDAATAAQPLIAKLTEQSKNVLDATHAAFTNATKPPSS